MPSAAIKEILVHLDNEGKKGCWIAKFMEYDVEIKPTRLVKGQGLTRLIADANCQALGLHLVADQSIEEGQPTKKVRNKFKTDMSIPHGMVT